MVGRGRDGDDFDAEMEAEGGSENLAGHGYFVVSLGAGGRRRSGWTFGEAELAGSSLGVESAGQFAALAGVAGEGQRAEGFGGGKVGRCAE